MVEGAAKVVLLVEDEPLIAMMLEDVLDAIGHSVCASCETVASGLDAVARGGMDVAILDLNLRDGEQSIAIADALADGGIPFLFATGGNGDEIPDRHRHRPTLSKPFTIEAVETALAAL